MRASSTWIWAIILCCVSACRRETAPESDAGSAPSGTPLDGMQLSSARRVALESALAALERGDVERLKQLNNWVRHRAQVAIFEPDDLKSLDLAIACLDHSSSVDEALAGLDQLSSGKLKAPATVACRRKQPPP